MNPEVTAAHMPLLTGIRKATAGAGGRLADDAPLIARLVIASVATHIIIRVALGGPMDMTGPLSALLITQASVYRTVASAFDRVLAVLSGVGLAIGLSEVMRFSALSLGIAVLGSLIIGSLLDLKDNKLEVPISAMLILSAAHGELASETRIAGTLIGTAVGLAVIFLFPVRPRIGDALEAVREVAAATATRADEIALGYREQSDPAATGVIRQISLVQPKVERARATVAEVRKSHVLNIAARRTAREHEADLMRALAALEDCLPQLQKLAVSLDMQKSATPGSDELRAIYAEAALAASRSIQAFGALFGGGQRDVRESREALIKSLERLRGAQDMLTEVSMLPGLPEASVAPLMSALRSMETIRHILDPEGVGSYRPGVATDVTGPLAGLTSRLKKPGR